jgi:putative SOS response-associated peptidase YedK
MCGRYVSTKSTGDLLDEFDAIDATEDEDVPYDDNVAPTVRVRTVVNRPPRVENAPHNPDVPPIRQLRIARWGLVSSWAKNLPVGNRLFNARSEKIAERPPSKGRSPSAMPDPGLSGISVGLPVTAVTAADRG